MREDYEELYEDLSDRLNRLHIYVHRRLPDGARIRNIDNMKRQLSKLIMGYNTDGSSVKVSSRPKRYNELEKFALSVLKELESHAEWGTETLDAVSQRALKLGLAANIGEKGKFTRTRDGRMRRINIKQPG